jgi:hypothetical protein
MSLAMTTGNTGFVYLSQFFTIFLRCRENPQGMTLIRAFGIVWAIPISVRKQKNSIIVLRTWRRAEPYAKAQLACYLSCLIFSLYSALQNCRETLQNAIVHLQHS